MANRLSKILGPDGAPLPVHEGNGHSNGTAVAEPEGARGLTDFMRDFERQLDGQSDPRGGLFEAGSAEERDYISEQIADAASRTNSGDGPSDLLETMEFYESSLWVYACVRAKAEALAQVPLVAMVQKPGSKPEEAPDSDLQALLDDPNDGLTPHDLILQSVTYLDLSGSNFVVGERANSDPMDVATPLVAFRPLNPSRMKIVPGGDWISHYLHDVAGRETRIAFENVGFSRYFDPNDDYWGLPPITVARRAAEVESTLESYNQRFLESGGHPDTVLETEADLGRHGAKRLERQYELKYKTPGKTGGAIVLDRGLRAKPFGATPKDMEFLSMSDNAQHRILAAFGTPPLLVMDLRDASVLANAAVQFRMFFDRTIRPLGRKLASSWTALVRTDRRFRSDGRQRWSVRFAFERVEQVLEDQILQRGAAATEWTAGLITRNEARSVGGWDPMEDESLGDELKPSAPAPGFGGAPVALSVDRNGQPRIQVAVTATEEFKQVSMASFQSLTRRWRPQWEKDLKTFFRKQKARVLRRFREAMNESKGHGDSDYADEALLAALFPQTEEDQALQDLLGPIFRLTAVDAGQTKLDALFPRSGIEFREDHERLLNASARYSAQRITAINDATRNAIRLDLAVGFADGLSNAQLQDALKSTFNEWGVGPAGTGTVQTRIERIAYTETGTALNVGGFEAARAAEDLGAQLDKQWLSARDGDVRESHRSLDAATTSNPVPLGEPFSNGLMHPSDPSGSAGEVINCRCAMVEVVRKEPNE